MEKNEFLQSFVIQAARTITPDNAQSTLDLAVTLWDAIEKCCTHTNQSLEEKTKTNPSIYQLGAAPRAKDWAYLKGENTVVYSALLKVTVVLNHTREATLNELCTRLNSGWDGQSSVGYRHTTRTEPIRVVWLGSWELQSKPDVEPRIWDADVAKILELLRTYAPIF